MGLTVLIADDETMPRMVLREHLPWAELGVTEIVEASDGDETVEQGTHEELLAQNGFYENLYNSQFEKAEAV